MDESVFHDLRDFHAELSDVPAALVKSEKYRVLKELGRGGMGVVYLAEHRRLERPVVLKVIHPKYVSDEKAIARLHQEAKSAARLHHPNIVATHDVEREGDTHFIVLGYVDGSDLAKLVRKRGPLPVHQACQLVKQAADGLQAAHEEGMVHRDIKPANLMLSRKGIVTILDFGLARLSRGTGGLVSVTGEVIGTPAFMAPEQARNAKSADIRADIYSLGGTLFYLLTGQPPFLKTDIIELMTALAVESPPALEEFRDDVPAGLAELIEKMLAKDREERPATPAELARALTPYTTKRASVLVSQTAALGTVFISQKTERPPKSPSGETPAPPPKAETGRRLWGIVVAAVGAVLVMALVLVLSLKGSGKTDTREKEARLPEMIMSERLRKGINNLPPAKVIEYKPKDALPKPGLPRAFLSASGGKMVFVKGERFWMGSPKEELNRSDDEKQHWVTVSSLYLGETEVTQGQFHRVMNYNPSFFARNAKGKNGVKYESINPGGGAFILRDITDTDELPVENVSWGEAKAFCDRLNELDISCPSGWVYRLPREAEWEYSCRGGAVDYRTFHFGNILDNSATQANFRSFDPYGSNNISRYIGHTSKVGSYPANRFGLRDMHGNVWEWCEDVYTPDYYEQSHEARDPSGPAQEVGSFRVYRGGCREDVGHGCRSAFRNGFDPAFRDWNGGFRVALVPLDRK